MVSRSASWTRDRCHLALPTTLASGISRWISLKTSGQYFRISLDSFQDFLSGEMTRGRGKRGGTTQGIPATRRATRSTSNLADVTDSLDDRVYQAISKTLPEKTTKDAKASGATTSKPREAKREPVTPETLRVLEACGDVSDDDAEDISMSEFASDDADEDPIEDVGPQMPKTCADDITEDVDGEQFRRENTGLMEMGAVGEEGANALQSNAAAGIGPAVSGTAKRGASSGAASAPVLSAKPGPLGSARADGRDGKSRVHFVETVGGALLPSPVIEEGRKTRAHSGKPPNAPSAGTRTTRSQGGAGTGGGLAKGGAPSRKGSKEDVRLAAIQKGTAVVGHAVRR